MMRFRELPLPGAVVVEADPAPDERGLFARLFDADLFRSRGLPTDFVQASASYNHRRGTLRGLHFQAAPHAETKLVRCTAGAAFDVIVDIRANSPQFGRWHAVEISALNRLTLIIPPGFAHGFETLADGTEISTR
jgi:dTDP-4-dehydrorhamnose 3,5-epimerase